MATEFTIFPQLIPELRLEIWRLALPAPSTCSLYPYKRGCWVVEDLGLEPDPNGEDLYLKFDSSLLDPLRIELPLHAVNREARDVARKYIREQNLVPASDSTDESEVWFLRHFDPRTDAMFLPTADINAFLDEPIDRVFEPDMENRNYSTHLPSLPRLAITPQGVEASITEFLDPLDPHTPKNPVYMIELANANTMCVWEREAAGQSFALDFQDTQYARLAWRSLIQEWESTEDEHVLSSMRQLIVGLRGRTSSASDCDQDVRLVRVICRESKSESP